MVGKRRGREAAAFREFRAGGVRTSGFRPCAQKRLEESA